MTTYIAYPPLAKATGGTYVFVQIAEILYKAGYDVKIAFREKKHHIESLVPFVFIDDLKLSPKDVWLVPEAWPQLLLPGLQAKARTIIYVQNWAFLHMGIDERQDLIDYASLPIEFVTVSQPVELYTKLTTGKDSHILRPGINLENFYPPKNSRKNDKIRIAYMPRKNKALARNIQNIVKSRFRNEPIEFVEIHNCTLHEVAELLRSCQIFLATGFPEGCPLPPLEAMASGCIVVGFGGFGGFDYMRQANPTGFKPWWKLRDESEYEWGENGFFCADSDCLAAAFELENVIELLREDSPIIDAIRENAIATAKCYSLEIQRENVLKLWEKLGVEK